MQYNKTDSNCPQDPILPDSALPCLNSNISTENNFQPVPLSTQNRKTAFILKESIAQLADRFTISHLGFLTLTFADHVICPKEAQRRLNSLISHVIKPRYREYVGVMERQKSGRIHYHLLIALDIDIRTGFDFDQVDKGSYLSASPDLRREWSFWRTTAKKYRFGRTELMPIKSNTEAMAKYVGKYIAKHIDNRIGLDKGVRLVRYSKGARAGTTRFQFNSKGSSEWRRKLAIFAQIIQERHPEVRINSLSDLKQVLGKHWAYNNRQYILDLP